MDDAEQSLLTGVLVTGDLAVRPVRPIQSSFMNSVIVDLQYQIADDPAHCLQKLARAIIELTGAQSSGVGILDSNQSDNCFKWVAVSGKWKEYEGHSVPCDGSPCGVVYAQQALQLFARPERCFPILRELRPVIAEGMYAPFDGGSAGQGVVWALFHREDLRFDSQDVFMLQELARLAVTACARNRDLAARSP